MLSLADILITKDLYCNKCLTLSVEFNSSTTGLCGEKDELSPTDNLMSSVGNLGSRTVQND
jgi:hypothetical protein